MSGSTSTSSLEQRANTTFPTIKIEKDGFYEIEYQAFIFCQRMTEQACLATPQDTDVIEVWVVNNDMIRKLQPFSTKQRKWSAQSDSISLLSGDLTVSQISRTWTCVYLMNIILDFGGIQSSSSRHEFTDSIRI